MSTPRIRLFASNVHFVDTDFQRLQPLAPVNSTLGKLILAVILGMLGLFVLGFWSDQEWLVVLGLLGAVVVPLILLGVSSWLHPPAREEAYFDAEGLLLKLVPARESEPRREVRIPFAALQDLVMESKFNREGSRIHQWRQYRIRTHQEGAPPRDDQHLPPAAPGAPGPGADQPVARCGRTADPPRTAPGAARCADAGGALRFSRQRRPAARHVR